MPTALIISYFLYKRVIFYKGFRIIFYLPAIISGVAMVAVYTSFIDPTGPLGLIVKLFGGEIPPEGLLGRPTTATGTIVAYCIWTGFCGNILLFSGAMARVPIDVLESAKLEGVGPFRELMKIIFPLIWPTVSTQIIFVFTGIFTSSGPILLFTNGNYETTTISFWIFAQVYGTGAVGGSGSYNLVSATGLCFTVVGVPIILFVRWLMELIPAVEY
jgi:ABC-type sugar transport system permease subunit